MKIYQYDGDNYCGPCGEAIAATLPQPDAWNRDYPDSCSYPVGYPSWWGESDTPDHCGNCELFLERNLTDDGIEYVLDAVRELAQGSGDAEIVKQWVEFYSAELWSMTLPSALIETRP